MLLGSHCIVLLNHYLDTILHECSLPLWEPPPPQVLQYQREQKKRRARRGERQKPNLRRLTRRNSKTGGRHVRFGGKRIRGSDGLPEARVEDCAADAPPLACEGRPRR